MKPLISIPFVIVIGLVLYLILPQSPDDSSQNVDPVQLNLAPPCGNPDSVALMALFNSTNGSGWGNNTGCGDTCDVCQWYGVSCNGLGRVLNLQL